MHFRLKLATAALALLALAPVATHALTEEEAQAQIDATAERIEALKAQKAELEAAEDAYLGVEPDEQGRYDQTEYLEATAALPPNEHGVGTVQGVENSAEDVGGVAVTGHTYTVLMTRGPEKGETITVRENDFGDSPRKPFVAGDRVVVVKNYQLDGSSQYYVIDRYRLPVLTWLLAAFLVAAIAVGKKRGLTSALGLLTTVGVIVGFVVPRVAAGEDPLMTCVLAAGVIAAVSLYLAHGFHARTTVAFVSTAASLGLAIALTVLYARLTGLTGAGNEDVLFLQGSGFASLDVRGLLLGGIILGVLGILDDVTTAQAAIVEELKAANPSFTARELFGRAMSVGREHVASLVNTLFLAYAGVSLPLFLLFSVNKEVPLWLVVNSETIAEEIVRTLVGSTSLVLAVPITTVLAAAYYAKRVPKHAVESHGHRH